MRTTLKDLDHVYIENSKYISLSKVGQNVWSTDMPHVHDVEACLYSPD